MKQLLFVLALASVLTPIAYAQHKAISQKESLKSTQKPEITKSIPYHFNHIN
ncbi:MAG TPA: hypothetical protein VGF30_07615 [Bacteroidia bacterium]